MKKTIVRILALAMVLALVLLSTGCTAAKKSELVIFSWADYIDPELLKEFTEQTGIEINYNYFNSEEEMLSKLEAVNGGEYDIILASDYILNIARKENLLKEIDKSKVPNYQNLNEKYLCQYYDPEGKYTIPYMGTVALWMGNTDKIAELGVSANSYKDL